MTNKFKQSDNVQILNENGMDGTPSLIREITKKGYKLTGYDGKVIKGYFKDEQLAPI